MIKEFFQNILFAINNGKLKVESCDRFINVTCNKMNELHMVKIYVSLNFDTI